jgi:hypothetical protein
MALPKLAGVYGEEQIEQEKPFSATLKNGVWTVNGTLWCSDAQGRRTSQCDIGGVAQIKLRQTDGKVLLIIHGK